MNMVEISLMAASMIANGLLVILMVVILKFTPGMTFLISKMTGTSVIIEKFKDSFGKFIGSQRRKADYFRVGGMPVQVTEGSQIIEKNSKVPMYFKFQGHGITSSPEYNAILQELEDMGIKLTKVEELVHIVNLSSDPVYRSSYLEKIQDPKKKKKEEDFIEKIKNLEILIKPYRTYKLMDIKNMYPFDINEGFMEGIAEEEVNLATKKLKRNQELIKLAIYGAVAFAIIIGVLTVFFMVVDIPDKKVVCDCISAGVQNAVV